jgi:type II secretory pathway pseudopilin PulG
MAIIQSYHSTSAPLAKGSKRQKQQQQQQRQRQQKQQQKQQQQQQLQQQQQQQQKEEGKRRRRKDGSIDEEIEEEEEEEQVPQQASPEDIALFRESQSSKEVQAAKLPDFPQPGPGFEKFLQSDYAKKIESFFKRLNDFRETSLSDSSGSKELSIYDMQALAKFFEELKDAGIVDPSEFLPEGPLKESFKKWRHALPEFNIIGPKGALKKIEEKFQEQIQEMEQNKEEAKRSLMQEKDPVMQREMLRRYLESKKLLAEERILLERFQKYQEELNAKAIVNVRAPNVFLDVTPEELLNLVKELKEALQTNEISWNTITFDEFMAGVDQRDVTAAEKRKQIYKELVEKYQTSLPSDLKRNIVYIPSVADLDQIFSEDTVGCYLVFSDKDIKKYFPEGLSKRLLTEEFKGTKMNAVLLRPQTLKIIKDLKVSQERHFVKEDTPPSNILYGYRGCGKSTILDQVVFWARRSGWLVVYIKAHELFNTPGYLEKSKLIPNKWDAPVTSVMFLNHIFDAHADKLKQIRLKNEIRLPKFKGTTLFDLVEYGAALEQYAADACVYFRNELSRVIEFPVLIAIDDYNVMWNRSLVFDNPESRRYIPEPLMTSDLTLASLFFNAHSDHKLANGTFVGATTENFVTRNMHIALLNQPGKEWLFVPPYTREEFETVMNHYKHTSWVLTDFPQSMRDYLYQLSAGFPRDLWKYTRTM